MSNCYELNVITILHRLSTKGPTRARVKMMPIGTPRVPYRTPGEGTWQWVDLWNALVGSLRHASFKQCCEEIHELFQSLNFIQPVLFAVQGACHLHWAAYR